MLASILIREQKNNSYMATWLIFKVAKNSHKNYDMTVSILFYCFYLPRDNFFKNFSTENGKRKRKTENGKWKRKRKIKTEDRNGNKNGTKELNPAEHGWFELTVPEAKNGSRYQFVMDGELAVPDPASRFQPEGVHGPSQLVNPLAFKWDDEDWQGRPWNEAVIYELHPGTFSPEGNYQGIIEKLPYLDLLGITAIELLPLADFPGEFNWGYDGVLPYSPARCYGSPEDLKELVNEAHKRGLMVFLDVVYNHFGPDGNYMYVYAQNFFNAQNQTPWGNSINYDGKFSEYVRQFAIDNVLYWLTEFRFDGLRFDAIDSIIDNSDKHLLTEISEAVRNGPGKDRHIHLILENVSNNANFLGTTIGEAGLYDSQWSDDIHHACHVLVTGEDTGYYKDFNAETSNMSALEHLGRSLAEGYSFQGQHSTYWGEKKRGTPSAHLPPTAFIAFTQNHDQVGNRAFGERITSLAEEEAVRAIVGIILLSPTIPMLFMGEERAFRRIDGVVWNIGEGGEICVAPILHSGDMRWRHERLITAYAEAAPAPESLGSEA